MCDTFDELIVMVFFRIYVLFIKQLKKAAFSLFMKRER